MVSLVIGSWGSYNECNERALGSSWLDLSRFSRWGEIECLLESEGFELAGIDQELFIQDIEGLPTSAFNCDYMSPQRLFEVLKASGVLRDKWAFDVLLAFLEVRTWADFVQLVEDYGESWADDVIYHKGASIEDVARDYFFERYSREVRDVLESLEWFIDFEGWARCYLDNCETVSDGVLEFLR